MAEKPQVLIPPLAISRSRYLQLPKNRIQQHYQMPFTFAHPAIILPLHSASTKWFSLTGLVIGSLAPDFEYFLRMKPQSEFSHTIAGIFYFNLPLGILMAFVFHNIVRNALIQNLPEFLRTRFYNCTKFNWKEHFRTKYVIIVASIIIGAASHIFWDSFTHETGYFVNRFEILKSTALIHNIRIPLYKLLQHGSTLVGVIIITFSIMKLGHAKESSIYIKTKYWLIVFTTIVVIVSARMLLGLDVKLYGQFIVSTISAFLLGLILSPLLIKSNGR